MPICILFIVRPGKVSCLYLHHILLSLELSIVSQVCTNNKSVIPKRSLKKTKVASLKRHLHCQLRDTRSTTGDPSSKWGSLCCSWPMVHMMIHPGRMMSIQVYSIHQPLIPLSLLKRIFPSPVLIGESSEHLREFYQLTICTIHDLKKGFH
jgi:hypothetical protein